jgi:Pentapeptide repeats (9 copies)/Pentapeptide repeats (8 copies)
MTATLKWPACASDCTGVRWGEDNGRCLAHLAPLELDAALKALPLKDKVDLRGVSITPRLLRQILSVLTPAGEDVANIATAIFDQATFTGNASFHGATFTGNASFRGATFTGNASFHGATFTGNASFHGATFTGNASFHGATFTGNTSFDNTKSPRNASFNYTRFSGDASFDNTTFAGDASFYGTTFSLGAKFYNTNFNRNAEFDATFSGDATFDMVTCSRDASFDRATFAGVTWFNNTTFSGATSFNYTKFSGDATFSMVTFSGAATFKGATFSGDATFRATFSGDATFSGAATFNEATFSGDATFNGVTFDKGASFDRTQFDGEASSLVDFSGMRLTGKVVLRVRSQVDLTGVDTDFPLTVTSRDSEQPAVLSLSRVNAANVVLSDVDLSRCVFSGAYNLDQIKMEGRCKFTKAPRKWDRVCWGLVPVRRWTRRKVLAEEAAWHAKNGPDRDKKAWEPQDKTGEQVQGAPPEQLAVLYRQLRKALEDGKDSPGAADFYYGEMDARRHASDTPLGERWLLHAYWLLSGYALRASRALAFLAATAAISFLLIMTLGLPSKQSIPERANQAGQIIVNAVIFRSTSGPLTTKGTWIAIISRIGEPVLLGFALVSARGRVQR